MNVGARLEQAASAGEILAGERTVLAARGAFEFGEPMTVEAKGKSGGLECRRLVRALSLMRPRGVGGLRRAFVGREAELAQLQDAYGAVAAGGGPQLVTILGDAGVGKTRLVRELWEWLATQDAPPLRRTGRCLSYGQGITYWPLAEVLKEHFQILDSDSPQIVAERLGNHPLLGLTLGLAPPEDLHPLAARERLHDSWVEFLDGLVADRPTVMLIEDVHWAEDDLCDLLETLVGQVDGPLLLLTTARPELLDRRPGWAGRRHASQLQLEALPPDGAGRLLDELLGVELPGVCARARRRAGRGEPVLRRGARGNTDRHACAPARERRLVVGRAAAGLPGARLGAGRARRPHRPSACRREVRAAGGRGDRADLLDRTGLRAGRGRCGRTSGCSKNATSSVAASAPRSPASAST